MSNISLTSEQHRFIEDISVLLIPWGMPQTVARLYGYFLLRDQPVSLDQIATDLEISKSGASVAAKQLEQYGIVKRFGERGTKRALYGISDNYAGILSAQSRLLKTIGTLLQEHAPKVASGTTTDRLLEMAAFYKSVHKSIETSIRRLNGKTAP